MLLVNNQQPIPLTRLLRNWKSKEKPLITHIISIANAVVNLINNQPTAYSVDKVVEELEIDSSVKLYGSGNSDNYLIPVKKAIEIVKQGGVSDDVCEWKRDEHSENDNPAEWIICPHKPKRIFSKDIKYCPYCGKKIKVVG